MREQINQAKKVIKQRTANRPDSLKQSIVIDLIEILDRNDQNITKNLLAVKAFDLIKSPKERKYQLALDMLIDEILLLLQIHDEKPGAS